MKFFIHPDGRVMLLPTAPISRLRGILKKPGRKPVTIEEMDDAIAEGVTERFLTQQASMIGLDTNVLVRYFAQDDPIQSAKAVQLIEHRLTEDEPGFISLVALVETVWVLQRHYRRGAPDVAEIVEGLLQEPVIVA